MSEQDALVPCCGLLQHMILVDGLVVDDSVVAGLAGRLRLDEGAFRRCLACLATRARHDALLDEGAKRGAFGVPTFFLGKQMFWGNDRLVLLEAALAANP